MRLCLRNVRNYEFDICIDSFFMLQYLLKYILWKPIVVLMQLKNKYIVNFAFDSASRGINYICAAWSVSFAKLKIQVFFSFFCYFLLV